MDVKQVTWRSFSGLAKFLTLFEALIIGFLSFWLYEESLANPWMAVYVNQTIQTEGAAIGIFVFIVVLLGGVTSMLFLRGKGGQKKVDLGSIASRIPAPSLQKPIPQSPPPTPKPTSDLHPVVAALKAELSGTPLGFGAEPLAMTVPKKDEGLAQTTNQSPAAPTPLPRPINTAPGSPRPSTVIVGAMPTLMKLEPRQFTVRQNGPERPLNQVQPNTLAVREQTVPEKEAFQPLVLKRIEPEKKPATEGSGEKPQQ